MGLIVRSSDIHAAGVYTTTPIPAGAKVVEYTGPIVTEAEASIFYDGRDETYLFALDDGRVINGPGIASFINHCCDANCDTEEIDGHIWIMATRDIEAGEELTYDYCLHDGDDSDPAICKCGAITCRGTMYSAEEVERRKKRAKETRKPVTVSS